MIREIIRNPLSEKTANELTDLTEEQKEQKAEWREAIFHITEKLAKYIRKERVKNLILLDRSARPIAIALKAYWKEMGFEEEQPNIYFINPQAIPPNITEDNYTKVSASFNEKFKKLTKDKDAKTLLFDVCMHEGSTMRGVFDFFACQGFSELRVGVIDDDSDFEYLNVDFSNDFGGHGCYLFGIDKMVQKNGDIVSERSSSARNREVGRRLRKELIQIIDEGIKKKENNE